MFLQKVECLIAALECRQECRQEVVKYLLQNGYARVQAYVMQGLHSGVYVFAGGGMLACCVTKWKTGGSPVSS